jgi:hypothetical protein
MSYPSLKPIQTNYNGYLFRSRLEARWAVFFDELGLEYLYETEGYEFEDKTKYLPDFYLPTVSTSASAIGGLWVEVKGVNNVGENSVKNLINLCNMTQHPGILVAGDPMENVLLAECKSSSAGDGGAWWICGETGSYEVSDPAEFAILDGPYIFCLCPWCGKIGIEFDGRGARVCRYQAHFDDEESALNAIKHLGHYRADDKCYTGNHPIILAAALKARKARFEYGDTQK